jgi:glycosyltransferase involved in cell wall biosynthesis
MSFAFSAATIGAFSARRADLCFVISPPPTVGFPALVLKYFRRIPYVYHVSDMWPDSAIESGMFGSGKIKSISEKILHWWCNLLYRKAEAVTVLADAPLEVLVERGVPRQKLRVVYNWADESLFHPLPRDLHLATELDIIADNFNIIYAGNFGVFQNLEIAIRAANSLKETAPKLRLILLGTGTEEASLRKLAEDLAATNVSFHGRRPYNVMPAISALSDVMLIHLSDIPLLRWTVPSKTQVAFAMGIPMLMAATSDTARLVTQSNAGVVCSPDNPEAMAVAMLELASMGSEDLHQLGQNGLEFYNQRLSLECGGQIMEDVFASVVGDSKTTIVN